MKNSLILLSTLAISQLASAAELHRISGAKLFDKDTGKELLYTMERKDVVAPGSGNLDVVTTFRDLSGTTAVVETCTFVNGKVGKFVSEQKQISAVGTIEVKGEEVHFTYVKEGKTSTAVEKLKENFVVSSSIVMYLQQHWAELAAGKKVSIRYGVPDRKETVGFDFSKESEKDLNGKTAWVVKMRPSSFLIAAIVNPLFFYFEPDGSKLLQIVGRVPVKKKVDSSFKDLDALTVYEYAAATPAEAKKK